MILSVTPSRVALLAAALAGLLVTQFAPLAQAAEKAPERRPRAPPGEAHVFCEYTRYTTTDVWIDVWVYLPKTKYPGRCSDLMTVLRKMFRQVEVPFHPVAYLGVREERQCYINFWAQDPCAVMEIVKQHVGEAAVNQAHCHPFADELVRPLEPFEKEYVTKHKRSLLDKLSERKHWLEDHQSFPPFPGITNRRWRQWSITTGTKLPWT